MRHMFLTDITYAHSYSVHSLCYRDLSFILNLMEHCLNKIRKGDLWLLPRALEELDSKQGSKHITSNCYNQKMCLTPVFKSTENQFGTYTILNLFLISSSKSIFPKSSTLHAYMWEVARFVV